MNVPNPLTLEPRIATMLFVDLVGSSEAASLKNQEDYSKLVSSFQNNVEDVFKDELCKKQKLNPKKDDGQQIKSINKGIKYYEVRGDEGFLILVSKYEINGDGVEDVQKDIRENLLLVLRIALRIKYEWLFAKENLDRFDELKKPFEVAIGINTGKVALKKEKGKWKAEGYAINLAKRIESQSRQGEYSGIYVSEYTFGYYNDIPGENTLRFRQTEKLSLKGISGTVRTYELISAILDEEDEILFVPRIALRADEENLKKIQEEFNNSLNPWLGNVLCNIKWKNSAIFWDKEQKVNAKKALQEAAEIARKIIEIDPNMPAWKIYLAQIIFDYVESYESDYRSKDEKVRLKYELLIRNTVEYLEKLITNEPHELDARLYLGKFYSRVNYINKILRQKKKIVKYYEMAVDQFQSIILWQDKFPDAYYELAAAYLRTYPGRVKFAMEHLELGINYAGEIDKKYLKKMKREAREDELFFTVSNQPDFKAITSLR